MLSAKALSAEVPRQPTRWYQIVYVPVVIAIVLGVLLEQCYPQVGESMKSLGDALIKLVKMIMIGQ
ncbi:hypothetical protein [Advenella sp. FME57]|uniref:hypothetical protein n=1 Tax=Advenella sp. FME57 TaxID=2742604 RepID=UPI0018661CF7|nr:hypothetical protein [Advenella sp. FME57]